MQREAGAVSHYAQLSLPLRVMNAVNSYWIYVFDSAWPTGLAFFYPHPMAASPVWIAVASGLALVGATLLFARLAGRRPYLIVGWLWYLGSLVPVIGLVQAGMQARADRYMYLPLIGLAIATGLGGARRLRAVARGPRRPRPRGRRCDRSALSILQLAAGVALARHHGAVRPRDRGDH